MFKRLLIIAAVCLFTAGTTVAQTKLLRFPDISGDRVVFTYGGDLWTTSTSGGTAVRLTAHPGVENYAKFSPDGKWIAFTGQYDGDEQVYVVSANGGEPKQLTFYPSRGPLTPRWGFDNQIQGWTKDGRIIFRSLRDAWTLGVTRLYTVSPSGGPAEALPMPEAGSGDMSPDNSKMAYSPRFRDFRPEKRYSGGQANTLYIYDLKTNDAKLISDSPRACRDAMWIGNTVYYNSDKDGKFDLYAYDTSNNKTTQVTKNRDWDIRWPSSDNQGHVIYERDGELETLDVGSKKTTRLIINVPNDGVNRRPRQAFVGNQVSWYALSPKGERALFAARGDIFTAPIEKGGTRNLTKSSDANDRFPAWSPDGKNIAYLSDKSGDDEVWLAAQDGSTAPQQLTTGGSAQRYAPVWSPDGKKIVFGDKNGKVYVVTIATKQVQMIVDAPNGQIQDYDWSPKSGYIAYSMNGRNGVSSVYIWSVEENKNYRVTPEMFNAGGPTWDPSGGYLYFVSNREYAPLIGNTEFNYASNRNSLIFALALRKDGKNPFPNESDEVTITEEKKDGPPTPPAPAAEKVDFDGIEARVAKAPIGADNYGGMTAVKGHLIYSTQSPFYYGRGADTPSTVKIFSLKDRKETTILTGTGGFSISGDGTKLMSNVQGSYAIFDANPNGERSRKNISTAGLVTEIDPVKEWNQIFNEVWRQYRDWFYAPNMHGFDWAKIRDDYRKWLPYVAHRSDLNYVLSEMQSELTVQHAYIDGGDFNLPPRVRVALPGARFDVDKTANRYRISKIFAGQNEEDIYRSPFTEVGNDARVGDYVIAINGEDVTADRDIYSYLRGKADSSVTFTLNTSPMAQGARTVTIRPLTSESDLVYMDWVEGNRRRVDQMSNGRLGYLHIPDMGAPGLREFIKWYYPQLKKEGLVIDVRANGGGNVSRMLIERLRRKVLGINFNNFSEDGNTYPDGAFLGPMIALLNENSSSDGDIFPYMFREAGLGQLVGKRSWGGVVGISNRGTLIDGGTVNVPQSALANAKGEYIIEGYGVDPDIEVENDPRSVIAGRDPQLERSIAELMKKIATPVKLPGRPADPVKNKP
ncbi:MAG: PD40 domain-containing protein [Chloracidobacterium sp.]|nr:PD40 domain-containing protein [Chloracidobacterium sp.]